MRDSGSIANVCLEAFQVQSYLHVLVQKHYHCQCMPSSFIALYFSIWSPRRDRQFFETSRAYAMLKNLRTALWKLDSHNEKKTWNLLDDSHGNGFSIRDSLLSRKIELGTAATRAWVSTSRAGAVLTSKLDCSLKEPMTFAMYDNNVSRRDSTIVPELGGYAQATNCMSPARINDSSSAWR